uniref:Uncharacterized protein LOC102801841 n=1 Tax=Saccoglossus kowalevskii TaxID=10224 RepID=A0ABM0LVF8_SACKO|nr:PREDICTED: uncharacterized protein LOC102801841 [Saccoglossus kowalevskii]
MAASNAGKVLFRCLHGHLLKIHHGYKLQTQRLLLGHLQVTTSTLNVRYFSPDSRSSSDSSSSSSDSESSSDSDIDSDTDKSAEDFLAKARKPPGYMAWEPVDDVYMLSCIATSLFIGIDNFKPMPRQEKIIGANA